MAPPLDLAEGDTVNSIATISGVYQISSVVTGERYIGYSEAVHNRWYTHQRALRRGGHANPRLQRLFDENGESDLVCKLLIICNKEMGLNYERTFINNLKPELNIPDEVRLVNVVSANRKRYYGPCTEDVKRRISQTLRGQRQSKEWSQKHSEAIKRAWARGAYD